MDAAEYKTKIISCLSELEKLGGNETEISTLKREVQSTSDPRKLMLMLQTMLEVLDKERGGKGESEFYIQTQDGIKLKAKTIQEGMVIARDYASRTNSRRTN